MPVTIGRTPIQDDDKTGTTGTSLDNAWKQEFYNQIDAALAQCAAVADGYVKLSTANVFTADQTISKTRPYLSLVAPPATDRARFGQQLVVAGAGRADMSANLSFDGTNLNADDTAKTSSLYTQNSGRHQWYHVPAGANPRSAAAVLLADLDPAGPLSLLLGQLKFPAAANQSSDPNTLDDYEEGTWTPTLTFNGASVGQTYSDRAATYVKIGSLVWCSLRFVCTNKGTSVGTAGISGLPFAEAGSLNMGGMAHYMNAMHTSLTAYPSMYLSGPTTLQFAYPQTGSVAVLTDVHFLPGTILAVISYRAL